MSLRMIVIVTGYLCLMLAGQLIWKKGLATMPGAFSSGPLHMLFSLGGSYHIWFGIALYAMATLLWLYLLSKYDLSFIYPLTSLAFVLGVLVSFIVLGESVTWNRWAGTLVIMFGVYLVTLR